MAASQVREWNCRLKVAVATSLRYKGVLCAYNALVDKQVFLAKKDLDSLANGVFDEFREPPLVHDEKTLAQALLPAFAKGKAAHIPTTYAFARKLESRFHSNTPRLGGQAGIIASQLASLGATSVLYSPSHSRDVLKLASRNTLFPIARSGRLLLSKAIDAVKRGDKAKTNWVLEFKEGQRICAKGLSVVCPRSNRLILSSPFRNVLAFEPGVEKLLPSLGKKISCVMLAGHHYLSDGGQNDFKRLVKRESKAIKALKKDNSRLRVHFEYVPFDCKKIEERMMEHAAENFDSLGINEVELVELCRKLGLHKHSKAIADGYGATAVYEASAAVMRKLRLQRIHVHGPGFHVLVLHKPYPFALERVRNAVLFSSVAATSKAILGREITLKELTRSLSIPLSQNGFKQMNAFARDKELGADFLRNGWAEFESHYCLVIPAQFAKVRKGTVGLGDVVSSCAFLAEA